MRKALALATGSAFALIIAQPALAQTNTSGQSGRAGAASDAPNDEIVVTATKVATNVQDVPIAITAVTAQALEDRQIKTFANLGDVIPNATFRKSGAIYGAGVSVTIRGLGTTDTQFSQEPAVAYYIDDIYYPFLFGSNFDLLDLDHVEVLRGPQGTLFGRNAISGAVNMVSKKPTFDRTSAYVDFTTGSRKRLEGRAGLNLPLTENLAVGVSIVGKRQLGYMKILDFSCEMYRRGTPQLAGTFPFASSGTSWTGGVSKPKSCVIGHYGGEDQRAGRATLRWEPASNIELNIAGDYSYANNEGAADKVFENDYQNSYGKLRGTDELGNIWGPYTGVVNEKSPRVSQNFITMYDRFSVPGTPFRWDERFDTGSMFSTYETDCDPIPAGTKITGNTYYNGSIYRGGNCWGQRVPVENWGVNAKLRVGITKDIEAMAIAGYRKIYTRFGAAYDGTPLVDAYIYHEDKMHYWSGEFRLTGRHGWLDWVGGLFYYNGHAAERGQPENIKNGTQQYHDVFYHPQAKAAYLNATFRPQEAFGILEGLSFNGGIRRSTDEKFVDYTAQFDATPAGSTTFVPSSSSTYFKLPIKNTRWDWKLGADYKINDDIMVYGSASTGYRLPGFNTRIFQAGQIEQQYPTDLISYEVGFKADLFDRLIRLNGNLFYMDYKTRNGTFSGNEARYDPSATSLVIKPGDQQLVQDGPAGTAWSKSFTNCQPWDRSVLGPGNGTTTGIECIGRTWNYPVKGGDPIKGFELEATLKPMANLVANYSMGYTDRGSTTGRPLTFPDWTMSGGIQYKIDIPAISGSVTPRLDWFWVSRIAWHDTYTKYDDPPRSTFNARISYDNREIGYSIALGVTNLTNKKYYLQKSLFIQLSGSPVNIGQPAEPRSWYLSASKAF